MAAGSQRELLAGRYRRLSTIGVGGMARVYLAEDERLGRRVAVKQLHASGPEDAASRFEREAKLGASLNHPNLVSIYDIATDDESVLIVMEHVDGETLQDAIRRGPLPSERVAEIVADVAAALDHAHSHGIVHRDVKPANILLRRDGTAKLADLGIATAAERTSITQSDVVLGTASYMAPEQLAGSETGPPADVYALAAVAFETLSGRKARTGRTPLEVAHEVVSGPPPDLRAAGGRAPAAAAEILARGMARDPDDRPPTAGRLAADLRLALQSRGAGRAGDATAPTAALAAAEPTAEDRATDVRPPSPVARGAAGGGVSGGRSRARRLAPALAAAAVVAVGTAAGVAALGGREGDGGRDAEPQRQAAGREAGGQGEADGQAEPSAEPAESAPAAEPAGDPVELNDRGYALMRAGDYEAAIPLLEQAVAAYPEGSQELTYAYALYNLGRSLRLAGRPEEAVPILERRLQIPNQTETVQRELEAARAAS